MEASCRIDGMSYSTLRKKIVERRPDLSIEAIDLAYEFAKKAHKGQKRYSGEAYIIHPVGVAEILLDLNPDLPAMQAALLHDVTEDTPVGIDEIEKTFGKEIAGLVSGLEKLAVVKMRKEDPQVEKWKKMFLAMAKDVRIVFIKLADRLHNMRTLHSVPLHKQERIARETLGVHAAIASRLGIYQIKSELEDLCFKFLYPDEYKELSRKLSSQRRRSEECMEFAISQLKHLLNREGVKFVEIQGRMKHLWSIYQKLQKKDSTGLDEIYDLFAVRIILPDLFLGEKEQVSHVYSVLSLLHAEYIPLPDRFKDYIAQAKPNGYRSVHTTILGLGGDVYDEPTEVQIRTLSMHKESEIGIASHWTYKLGKKGRSREVSSLHSNVEEQMAWLRGLAEKGDLKSEIDLYPDRIFVLTPKEKVIELPQGANPIDFAFAVHTEVGNKMINAKANGKIVPLDYELKNGEVVEIVTRNNAKPNRYWISLARTASARSKIKNWFNKQDKSVNIAAGREMVNKELQSLGKTVLDDRNSLLKNYSGITRSPTDREHLLENVGLGTASAVQIVRTLFPEETAHARKKSIIISAANYTDKVLVTGEENLPVVLSACCKPKPPHSIIGYVTRGQFIRIHKENCKELSALEKERFVSAKWKERQKA